jgi:hypothetical protein
MSDFGPGSIDDWLGDVVGREQQVDDDVVVDLLRHLRSGPGVAVTREDVFGHRLGSLD